MITIILLTLMNIGFVILDVEFYEIIYQQSYQMFSNICFPSYLLICTFLIDFQ